MLSLSSHLLITKARSLVGEGLVSDDRPVPPGAGSVSDDEPERHHERPSWDLSFVQHCGYWAHRDPRTGESYWPIPAGMTRTGLGKFGEKARILYDTPEVGDIFLQYGPFNETFVRVGIVMGIVGSGHLLLTKEPFFLLYTVESDTGPQGQLHGGLTLRVRRRFQPATGDRFLSWMELDPSAAQPARRHPRIGSRRQPCAL